jgi:hypothetical protein
VVEQKLQPKIRKDCLPQDSSSFPCVQGHETDRLVAVLGNLCEELGFSEDDQGPGPAWLEGHQTGLWEGCLDDDRSIPQLREALAKLAWAATGGAPGSGQEERAVLRALDGVELVMRAELAAERAEMLTEHLPGFVYVVVLPRLGQERAIDLSRRIEQLTEAAE